MVNSGGLTLAQDSGVVTEDSAASHLVEFLELDDVVERLWHAFDVRPVGPEDHALRAHQVDDLVDVVLPKRVDPNVPAEGVRGVFGEVGGKAAYGRAQLAEQVGEKLRAVLDRRNAHSGEPLENAVEDQRDEKVVSRALHRHDAHRWTSATFEGRGEAVVGVALRRVAA